MCVQAYGKKGSGEIPADATLEFDVVRARSLFWLLLQVAAMLTGHV